MRELFIELAEWLALRLNSTKFSEVEKFLLENYPPLTTSIMVDYKDCKLLKTSDLVNAINAKLEVKITFKQCAMSLQSLGYKQIAAFDPDTKFVYKFWLIK